MRIILTGVEDGLVEAWTEFCGDLEFVTVHRGSILDLTVDAVVSPANSFGFMDGGIDLRYSQHFGWKVQDRLQAAIRTRHHGELLVGRAEIVGADHDRIPFLIAAPTMRVPMILRDTVNPYLAARAVLLRITEGRFEDGDLIGEPVADAVQSVAFPGLGTGVGQVPFNTCAHQLRQAIDEVLVRRPHFPRTWAEAQMRHQRLYTDRVRDLQRGE
jgi:O-acetyl-ADP-ribose deacetylase (regulator of RNase III)